MKFTTQFVLQSQRTRLYINSLWYNNIMIIDGTITLYGSASPTDYIIDYYKQIIWDYNSNIV
jgi:hypothetical protein